MESYAPSRKANKSRSTKNIQSPNKKAAKNKRRNLNRKIKPSPEIDRVLLIANARTNRILNDKSRRIERVKRVIETNTYEETLDDEHSSFIALDNEINEEYLNSMSFDDCY
jgi:hypothetical protein